MRCSYKNKPVRGATMRPIATKKWATGELATGEWATGEIDFTLIHTF